MGLTCSRASCLHKEHPAVAPYFLHGSLHRLSVTHGPFATDDIRIFNKVFKMAKCSVSILV
jgi:hypothetical protein